MAADAQQVGWPDAFAALQDGKAVRRNGWASDVRWTWFGGTDTADASVVEEGDGPPVRKVALDSIGLKDLMAVDWIVLDGGA